MAQSIGLLDHFSALKDPREQWRFSIPCGGLAAFAVRHSVGDGRLVEINLWGRERLDFLRRFLPFEHGVPSHDTLNDIVNAMDGKVFQDCFTSWVETLRDSSPDIVAITARPPEDPRSRDASPALGVGLGKPSALGVGAGGRDRQVQRDRRDPSVAQAPGVEGSPRHHRRDRNPGRNRQDHRERRRRLSARAEGQLAGLQGRVETFFADDTNATAFRTFDTTDADTAASNNATMSSAKRSTGCFRSGAFPRSARSLAWP